MNTAELKPRYLYFDLLRAIAIFAVIILHNSTDIVDLYNKVPLTTWAGAVFYNGLTRFCVPMFVAISGALLLNPGKEATINALFKKRLPKLLIPLIFWSVIYFLLANYAQIGWEKISITGFLKTCYQGPVIYHFWFLYMMIGIYLIYPIINLFITAAKPVHIQYFLLVWFATNSILAMVGYAFALPTGIDLSSFTGFVGYFVLGYYLQNVSLSKSALNILYVLCAIAFVTSVSGIALLHYYQVKSLDDIIESDFTPELPFAVAGLFLLAKNHLNSTGGNHNWGMYLLNSIGNQSYGIYLVHVFIMQLVFAKGRLIYLDDFSPFWSIPLKAVLILAISYVVSRLFKAIPFLRKTV